MARRWTPTGSVESNETIGRRLFDEPMLRGTNDQPNYYGIALTHFEETRGSEISVDRLGRTSIEPKVISYLLVRANRAGESFHKPLAFDGWATIHAKELRKGRDKTGLKICPSPVSGSEPDDNVFHAHILKPDDTSSHDMALRLRHLFMRHGRIHSVATPSEQRWWQRVVAGISNLFK